MRNYVLPKYAHLQIINVASFLVFQTEVTVNIGLKDVVRMVASIPSIRCLCYEPERIRN